MGKMFFTFYFKTCSDPRIICVNVFTSYISLVLLRDNYLFLNEMVIRYFKVRIPSRLRQNSFIRYVVFYLTMLPLTKFVKKKCCSTFNDTFYQQWQQQWQQWQQQQWQWQWQQLQQQYQQQQQQQYFIYVIVPMFKIKFKHILSLY